MSDEHDISVIERAERVLREGGIRGGAVTLAGHESEIAAIAVPAAEFGRLLGPEGERIVGELKRLGFRYVALDLEPAG